MTSEKSKTHCVTCSTAGGQFKGVGQFKCEGCSQTFCAKHVVQHRQTLNQHLDEIILEHDTLKQTVFEQKSLCHIQMAYIAQWEQRSFEKIRQMAEEAREQVVQHASSLLLEQAVTKELHHLSKRIEKAREEDDFFETDLQNWKSILQKMNKELKTASTLNNIKEDKTVPLIYQIQIIASPSNKRSLKKTSQTKANHDHQMNQDVIITDEIFYCCHGGAVIQDEGRLVTLPNGGTDTEIRGKMEYSSGKHRLRLKIEKNPYKIWIFIGIISKLEPMGIGSCNSLSSYGWIEYDDFFLAGERQSNTINSRFLNTVENDVIELVLDCTKRIICYTNERTKKSKQLNIDISKCPFPWQLHVNLIGSGDQVRLLSTTSVL